MLKNCRIIAPLRFSIALLLDQDFMLNDVAPDSDDWQLGVAPDSDADVCLGVEEGEDWG